MNRKGRSEAETIAGILIFFVILFVLLTSGFFVAIFRAFNDPVFMGFGALLGILFILAIVTALFEKLVGK